MIGLESAWTSHVLVLFSIGVLNSTYCLWKMCGEGVEAFSLWIQGHANVLVKCVKTCFSGLKHQAPLCQLSPQDGVFLKLTFLDWGSHSKGKL